MVTLFAKFKIKAEEAHKVEQLMREITPKVQEEEGTLNYIMHKAQGDPTTFLAYEQYKDMDAFMYHSSTPHVQRLVELLPSIIEGSPEMEFYDEVARLNR